MLRDGGVTVLYGACPSLHAAYGTRMLLQEIFSDTVFETFLYRHGRNGDDAHDPWQLIYPSYYIRVLHVHYIIRIIHAYVLLERK